MNMNEEIPIQTNPSKEGINGNIESTPIIQEANVTAARMEKASNELKIQNDRREAILAREILGGRSSVNVEVTKKEETPKEYAKRIMSGKI